MTDQPVIHTEGLTKHYGDVKALLNLSLDIRKGEIFGFLGPNGAGKTTTIRTLMDEIRPTAGQASILGMDSHEKSVEIRKHLGYLPGGAAGRYAGRHTARRRRGRARRHRGPGSAGQRFGRYHRHRGAASKDQHQRQPQTANRATSDTQSDRIDLSKYQHHRSR